MKILIDTNIMIDIFTRREPWFQDSYRALSLTLSDENHECLFSASAVTDVYYLLHRFFHDKRKTGTIIEKLAQITTIADVQASDIQSALASSLNDFEDAVIDAVAKRHQAAYILTRNTRDFEGSRTPAITPEEYLKKIFPESGKQNGK